MEGACAVKMFSRSVDKHKLVYKEYLGDGYTSSFKEVTESDPYASFGLIPEKLECVVLVRDFVMFAKIINVLRTL